MSDLSTYGWNAELARALDALSDPSLLPARVISVHRGGCSVAGAPGGAATLRGRLTDEPVVGDWVALAAGGAIEHVLPRRTLIARRAPGRASRAQPICANVDRLFVVTTPDADFSPRRLERYLAVAWDGGAEPVVVLAKCDQIADVEPFLGAISAVAPGVTVLAVSAHEGRGIADLAAALPAGVTGALVGSSGVGKSTLVNALAGAARQTVGPVRAGDAKGRHTTTARELLLLPGGGLLIDTPGMRELGLAGGDEGLRAAFADVEELAAACRFRDCTHGVEPGCAVRGTLDGERVEALRALAAEQAYEERRRDASRAREEKDRMRVVNRALRARARREPKLRKD